MPLRDSSINRNFTNFPIKLSPSSYLEKRQQQISQTQRTFTNDLAKQAKCEDDVSSSDSENEGEDAGRDREEKPGYWRHAAAPTATATGGESAAKQENPLSHITGNPIIMNAMKKLMELQEQEDIQRFNCRLDPSQRKPKHGHPHSDCCFANNCCKNPAASKKGESKSKPQRKVASCGPFLSCGMRHSKSNDYEELPDFYVDPNLMKNAFFDFYAPDWLQRPPNSNPATRGQTSRTSRSKEGAKCRRCPKTSIFLSDPDLWHADYKYQVTYGRIPTAEKKRLKEKIQHWLPSDDYKEKQVWLKNRMAALSKYQANHRRMHLRQQANGLIDKDISRRPFNLNEVDGPMYGPSAIAALNGYNSPRTNPSLHQQETVTMPQGPNLDHYLDHATFRQVNQDPDTYYTGNDVPYPSDNIRFYDDDTDPRVVELLAQAPFLIPTKKTANVSNSQPSATTSKSLPLQPSASKTSQIAGPSSSSVSQSSRAKTAGKLPIPIITVPVEDLVTSARAPNKNETLTTKQTPTISPKKTAEATPVKDGLGGNKSKNTIAASASSASGDKSAKSKSVRSTLRTAVSKSNTGGSRKGSVKSKKHIPKFVQNKRSKSAPQKVPAKISEPLVRPVATSSSSSKKANLPTTSKPLHVKKRISKPKIKRRFKKTISTVSLEVPKSKDKVSFDDDK